ncbi:bacterial regulatory s/ tetR family protein [Synechococcus sp. A15-60]|nr:bacterial regulatory s/ tetR family protein [Synechococcus sp. A15-60]
MHANGASTDEIAKAAGITRRMVYHDLDLVREAYVEDFEGAMEAIRAELAAKHNAIYSRAIRDYERGAGLKALEIASRELECLARIHGVSNGVNVNLHQHSVNVTAEAVSELFKPLDAESYGAMVAAKPLPPAADAAELPVIDVESEQGSDEWTTAEVAAPTPEPPVEPQGLKRVRHPLGRL